MGNFISAILGILSSALTGISQPSLSRIENGNQEITFQFLKKACETFNISMSDFFRNIGGKK
ncbi:helix-turn-helix domain-containing protein [Geobacillus zalihae]|uniref:helix-turn-helix domain-containing protein n=1 Tax=Geobacillus zalihae TaxID=213419 RepID=UPI000ABA7A72|nr:helix-turn-helix transcriptional regulator [Geobacillus zalihae]